MLRIACVFLLFVIACAGLAQSTIVQAINIKGNKRTRPHVILRELPFAPGDTINTSDLPQQLQQAENNLRGSGLFNFVSVADSTLASGSHIINISVVERWYLWPVPIFENAEPNFNTWWEHRRLDRTNYGMDLLWNNFRGRRERLRVLLRLGFTEQVALEYSIPYLNKKANMGVLADAGFYRSREVNALSLSNKRVFVSSSEAIIQEVVAAHLGVQRRFGQVHKSRIVAGFQDVKVNGAPQETLFDYLPQDSARTRFLSLSAHWKTDRRDYLHYPTQGYMFEAELVQYGFGLLNNAPDVRWLTAAMHRHQRFLKKRAHASAAVLGKWNLADAPPYYLQRGLGYQTRAIRGYELYVMDGQSYLLLKTGIRYLAFGSKRFTLPFIRKQAFSETLLQAYVGVHFDAGYVDDQLYAQVNSLSNDWQYGGGVGIDFVSYYDKVLRIEYSFNRLGESGLFLHFTKPI